jgi:mono/diheme cytochrome c family protein
VGVIVLILSVVAVGTPKSRFHNAPASASTKKNPYIGHIAAAKAGATAYEMSCSACHGKDGGGNGTALNLRRGATQSASDGELFWFITTGDVEKGMPSFEHLTSQQRWQIVTYLKSLPMVKVK